MQQQGGGESLRLFAILGKLRDSETCWHSQMVHFRLMLQSAWDDCYLWTALNLDISRHLRVTNSVIGEIRSRNCSDFGAEYEVQIQAKSQIINKMRTVPRLLTVPPSLAQILLVI
jgi:hypothetical protein